MLQDNAASNAQLTDEQVRSGLGKRDLKRLESGKATLADLRKAMLGKDNAADQAIADQAIATLRTAFSTDLPDCISVEVSWKKSRTWGFNPTVEVWADGYTTGSASGCGYDKESAATAEAFNKSRTFARIAATCAWLDMKESKATGNTARTYGLHAGYNGFTFSGGVGYSCHDAIITRAGYALTSAVHPKSSDCYYYKKK